MSVPQSILINTVGAQAETQLYLYMKLVLILILLTTLYAQKYEADRVTGMSIPYSHPWYSGYLNISSEKAFHYVLFESQHNPDTDPLILWLNGGPGCSSLIGFSYENGPFKFHANRTNIFMSNHSWNREANLLYIESPGSVGFSLGPVASSDESVQQDNLKAMVAFFSMFPVFRKNPFYLSGESYAGIYVPYLAYAIHNHNLQHSTAVKINMKGIIVGNACTHPDQCYLPGDTGTSMYQYEFLYKHAYYSDEEYHALRSACVLDYDGEFCKRIRSDLDKSFASTNTSILNIYSKCYYQDLGGAREGKLSLKSDMLRGDLDCDDSLGAYQFFNDESVRVHLNVADRFGFSKKWTPCSEEVQKNYKMSPRASYYIYHILMREGYRVWVYSGDVDADVPVTGTIMWLQRLREDFQIKIERPWREWWVPGKHKSEDQVGGMVWQLQNLTFVSFKGAGHMVPKDKPEAAYVLIDHFLRGVTLPEKFEQ